MSDDVGVQIGLRVREQRIKHKVRGLEVERSPDFQMSACQWGLFPSQIQNGSQLDSDASFPNLRSL